jgi:hypothetical protein
MDRVPNGNFKATGTYVVIDSDSDSDAEGNRAFSLHDIVLSFMDSGKIHPPFNMCFIPFVIELLTFYACQTRHFFCSQLYFFSYMMSCLSAFLPNTIFYSRSTLEHSDEEKKRIHCMFEMIVCDHSSEF